MADEFMATSRPVGEGITGATKDVGTVVLNDYKRQGVVVQVDFRVDLDMEDASGTHWASIQSAIKPADVTKGAVLKAGSAGKWSWVKILAVLPDGSIHFTLMTLEEVKAEKGW